MHQYTSKQSTSIMANDCISPHVKKRRKKKKENMIGLKKELIRHNCSTMMSVAVIRRVGKIRIIF